MSEFKKPTPEERIQEANKKICKAVCLLQSAQEIDLEFAFDKTNWDDEVRWYLDKALKNLAYVVSTLATWNDEEEGD